MGEQVHTVLLVESDAARCVGGVFCRFDFKNEGSVGRVFEKLTDDLASYAVATHFGENGKVLNVGETVESPKGDESAEVVVLVGYDVERNGGFRVAKKGYPFLRRTTLFGRKSGFVEGGCPSDVLGRVGREKVNVHVFKGKMVIVGKVRSDFYSSLAASSLRKERERILERRSRRADSSSRRMLTVRMVPRSV